jgi:glycosyltransferase involved in cell wall biosynthesis
LHQLFGELRPDVVHSHNYVLRYSLPAALASRVPAMAHTIHNVADREVDRMGVWLQKLAFRSLVTPVAIAEEVVNSYQRVYRLPRPALIPNGIAVNDYSDCRRHRARIRKELGYTSDDLLLICVARFWPQKNHHALLEAFARGPVRHAHLLLVGDGALQPDLERQATALKVSDRARFLGRRDDIPALLGASDAFVLASLWEGNPLSVMEAMSAGLPIAVTGVGGIPELAIDEVSGLIVPPGDEARLTSAMMRLIERPELRESLGRNAAVRAMARFDHHAMTRAYESLYETLLPEARQRRAYAAVA